jgi:predicted Fe-S protein YdhL (DUF1289 family)
VRLEFRPALVALLLLLSGAALAAGPQWKTLSPQQQALITPAIKGEAAVFDQLPESRRQRLADGAARWLQMNPEQRAEASQQLSTWQRMNAGERQQVLDRREQFRKLPASEQRRLLDQRRRFEALPPLEQERLKDIYRRNIEQQTLLPSLTQPLDSLLPAPLPPLQTTPPPTSTTGGLLPY